MARRRDELIDTLRQRIISGLHFGTFRVGDRLPSARRLAAELGADARVVMAAYRRLEREALVVRRPGSRSYVIAAPPAAGGAPSPAEEWLVDVLTQALSRGMLPPHFPEHVRRSLETLRLRAACIECNRDHIVWLCRELQESFGLEAVGVEVDALASADVIPTELRQADLLVTTPDHYADAQPVAARLGKRCIAVTLRPDILAEVRRLLAAGPVYFVGTDERFAAKVRHLFGAAGADNVRPVILGRDDPAAIPAGAPAYVMRTARDRLGGPPPQARALATLRALSTDTAREILAFVVRENTAAAAARARQ